ncbi:uncharacterized protein LOC107424146 [Ziziphus jujuba]|uniref:Uncharacterized protein LOC107424146 n=1 Tax=Ziziphus jujuba TaxID=326968 RepID=A0A6P4A763_ZIZJJ|nr:uncharacterized protein LOC107424146 [Ziziphus jujuba]
MYFFSPLMELNKEDLQFLVEKAWSLHGRLNGEIKNSISFCRFCPEHGRNFHIAETPFDERERLIIIRDSLKEVEDNLMFLQSLGSWQVRERHAALTHLEERRLDLIEKVTKYPGRELDVVRELYACFGNENAERLKRKKTEKFLSCCNNVGKFIVPWKWQNVVGIAVKFLLVSASISSLVPSYRIKHLFKSSSTKIPSICMVDSTTRRPRKIPLDVFYGRG